MRILTNLFFSFLILKKYIKVRKFINAGNGRKFVERSNISKYVDDAKCPTLINARNYLTFRGFKINFSTTELGKLWQFKKFLKCVITSINSFKATEITFGRKEGVIKRYFTKSLVPKFPLNR